MLRTVLALFVAATVSLSAQFAQRIDPVAMIDTTGESYPNPFGGGVLSTRIVLRNVIGDRLPDLLVLNPDFRLRLYRNCGDFTFSRVIGSAFDTLPANKWFRLADLDADGADDYVTGGPLSEIIAYRNLGSTRDPLYPHGRALTYIDPATPGEDTIRTELETVPSFVDIDADHDLDILTGNVDGTISYYRNDGSESESRFVFVTSHWFDIQIISGGRTQKDDGDVRTPAHHGASIIEFADTDRDGDLDIYYGDFFLSTLLHFINTGTPSQPEFSFATMDTAYSPPGDRITSAGFNSAVHANLDGDGDLDAIVTSLYPNISASSLVLYENVGTAALPIMRSRSANLTGEFDAGLFAAPVLIRDAAGVRYLVGDGGGSLREITVDTAGGTWRVGREQVPVEGLSNVVPAAGDLDGDGTAEAVLGSFDGDHLRLVRRTADGYRAEPWSLDTAAMPSYSAPELVDLDSDGDLDLLVGGLNGRFIFFRNIGTPALAQWERQTAPAPFDTLDLGAHSTVRFADIDNDGALDALCGARPSPVATSGEVRFLLGRGDIWTETAAWPRIRTDVEPVPTAVRIGGVPRIVIGERAGGMTWWETRDIAAVRWEHSAGHQDVATKVVRPGEIISLDGGNNPELPSSTALIDIFGREYPLEPSSGSLRIPAGLASGLWTLLQEGRVRARLLVLP